MAGSITIKVDLRDAKLDALIKQIPEKAETILDKSAMEIMATAIALETLVDTGFLRSSIQVVGPGKGSGGGGGGGLGGNLGGLYGGGRGASLYGMGQVLNSLMRGAKSAHYFYGQRPDVDDLQRAIWAAAHYAVYVEDRKPYMSPAAEAHRKSFLKNWYALV